MSATNLPPEPILFETDEPSGGNPAKASILIGKLWPNDNFWIPPNSLQAYSNYHHDQCCLEEPANHALHTHGEMAIVIDYINRNPTAVKRDILNSVLSNTLNRRNIEESELENSMHLIMRLWLMINIRSTTMSETVSLETPLPWPTDVSISDLVQSHFKPDPSIHVNKGKFSKYPTAKNLELIGGFHITWTDNLIDHLLLKDQTLFLFYNVSILRRMRSTVSSEIIPQTVYDETLHTISLLIPRTDNESLRWLESQRRYHRLDTEIERLELAPTDVSSYHHWKERLLIIQETLEETEPSTLSQWWHDRRKRVQWYTFWVALLVLILTIVFGLIQSISGVVQAWASVQSLNSS